MKAEDAELARKTFDRLRPIPPSFGLDFYEALFELDPGLKALFRGNLENQAAMFVSALGLSLAGLGGDGFIAAPVRELGERHRGYGVPDSAYETFGKALLQTLRKHLGEAFTPEVEAAWQAAYSALAGSMQHAAAHAGASPSPRRPGA